MRTIEATPIPAAGSSSLSRRGRIGRIASAIVLAVLAMQGGTLSAARADGPQTVRVTSTTGSSVSTYKSHYVDCPTGKKVVGAAFNVNGAGSQVRISSVIPGATRVTVGAAVDPDGFGGAWSLTAVAVCTSKPLNGLEITYSFSDQDLVNPKAATATCPDGKQLLGTGAMIWGSATGVVIEGVFPNSSTDSVMVRAAHGQTGPSGTWAVGAIAICATVPWNNWVSTVVESTEYDSVSSKAATARCPSGSVLFGAGGAVERQLGFGIEGPPPPYPPAEVVLDEFTPNGSMSTSPTAVTVWANEDQDSTTAWWRVTSYALCYGGDFVAP